MPVEIRELVIRTTLEDSASSGVNGPGSGISQESPGPAEGAMNEEVVRQIMDTLKRQKER